MAADTDDDGRSGADRDRELMELLTELRVALPGVQVLFAFLLTVPFAARFTVVDAFGQRVYFATLLCCAASSLLLIAPTPIHRLLFRQHDKDFLLHVNNVLSVSGVIFLGLGMAGSLLLVADVLFSRGEALVTGGTVLFGFIAVWFVLPLQRRLRSRD